MNDRFVCPKCGHFDKIEKVSAIVSHQTRIRKEQELRTETHTDFDGKSHTSTYSVPYDVVESTDLAKHLKLPPKPQAGGDWRGCFVIVAIGLVAILCMGMFWFWSNGDSLFYRTTTNSSSLTIMFVVVGGFIVSVIGLLIITLLFYWGTSVGYKREVLRIEKETRLWMHAAQRWDKAYYCYRDDVVFIPDGKNEWASLSHAERFFFSP